MNKQQFVSFTVCSIVLTFFLFIQTVGAVTLYEYDFEDGWNGWYTDNGVWDVGTPTAGPDTMHNGTQCAGTVLDGYYPSDTDSRLISPSIILSEVSGDEEIFVYFWQWFSYAGGEVGYIQLSYYDENLGEWSDFSNVGNSIVNSSPAWSRGGVDITEFAGEMVRIAFYHTAHYYSESYGWYIDNIEIIQKVPGFIGGFEAGWNDWYTDRGVWQVGIPTAGPDSAYGGVRCAGTILGGSYPSDTDSRLISATLNLPEIGGGDEIFFCFRHWLSYAGGEAAYVQVSVYNDSTSDWSSWETIDNQLDNSSVWSYVCRELTDYAGETVRIAFFHTAHYYSESSGWYIDNIEFSGFTPPPPPPPCEATFNSATGELHIPTVILNDNLRFTVEMQHQGGRRFDVINVDPQ